LLFICYFLFVYIFLFISFTSARLIITKYHIRNRIFFKHCTVTAPVKQFLLVNDKKLFHNVTNFLGRKPAWCDEHNLVITFSQLIFIIIIELSDVVIYHRCVLHRMLLLFQQRTYLLRTIRDLERLGFNLYASNGTADFYKENGVAVSFIFIAHIIIKIKILWLFNRYLSSRRKHRFFPPSPGLWARKGMTGYYRPPDHSINEHYY